MCGKTNLIMLPHSTTRIRRKARTHASKFLVKHLTHVPREIHRWRGAYIQSAGHRKKRKMREKGEPAHTHTHTKESKRSVGKGRKYSPGRPPERRLSGHKNTHAAKTQHPQLNNSAAADGGCVFFNNKNRRARTSCRRRRRRGPL